MHSTVVDVQWESVRQKEIWSNIGVNMGALGIEMLIAGIPKGPLDIIILLKVIMMGKQALYDRFSKLFKKKFDKGIKNAKITGQLLAISLILGHPFSNHTISLVGYSMGCEVIKSCLLTLSRLGGYEFVHNVTFLAGATHFTKDQDLWRLIFSRVVNGKISNVFSKGD